MGLVLFGSGVHIFLFVSLVLISLSCAAKTYQIDVVSDYAQDSTYLETDLATRILFEIEKQSAGKLNLNVIPASRTREWRQLQSHDNVCLYNKVKTPEREKIATFSRFPLVAYPANRLVLKRTQSVDSNKPLDDAVMQQKLKIGITKGRAYGDYIDGYIAAHQERFVLGEGQTSAMRLRKMLLQGRIDGMIEYSAVFINEFGESVVNEKLAFIEVENQAPTIFGYIACSSSSLGQQAIAEIERVLSQPTMMNYILKEHMLIFKHQHEQAILTKSIQRAFNP